VKRLLIKDEMKAIAKETKRIIIVAYGGCAKSTLMFSLLQQL
jgi:hypothetical protein